MEKKTGMFTGWKTVFSFTANQTIKGKGFIGTTILVAAVVLALFLGINVVMATSQVGDKEQLEDIIDTATDVVGAEGKYDFTTIKEIYLVNETEYSDENIMKLFAVTEKNFETIDGIKIIDNIKAQASNKNTIILDVTYDYSYDEIKLNILKPFESNVDDNEIEVLGEIIVADTALSVYQISEFDEKTIELLGVYVYADVSNANEDGDTIGTTITKIFVPMIFSLFMYMIILLHGQSISKAIVADKSSKLMEMLLTSVKPYAIIAGKILGTAAVAIMQLGIWIASGIVGFIVGDVVAKNINPDYHNFVLELIDIMKNSSNGTAFSIVAIILAIVGIVIGFFMYCVLAGLSGAMVSKVEDLSSAATLFQLPVIVAFMVSYFATISSISADGQSVILEILRIVPVTSPFLMPADILIGNMTIVGGLISLAVMVITCLAIVLATGKIYINKIFYKH